MHINIESGFNTFVVTLVPFPEAYEPYHFAKRCYDMQTQVERKLHRRVNSLVSSFGCQRGDWDGIISLNLNCGYQQMIINVLLVYLGESKKNNYPEAEPSPCMISLQTLFGSSLSFTALMATTLDS